LVVVAIGQGHLGGDTPQVTAGLADRRHLAVELQGLVPPPGPEQELDVVACQDGVAVPQLDGPAIQGDRRLKLLLPRPHPPPAPPPPPPRRPRPRRAPPRRAGPGPAGPWANPGAGPSARSGGCDPRPATFPCRRRHRRRRCAPSRPATGIGRIDRIVRRA